MRLTWRNLADDWQQQARPLHLRHDEACFANLRRHAAGQLTMVLAIVDGKVGGVEVLAAQGPVVSEFFHVWDRAYSQHHVSTALIEACYEGAFRRGRRWTDAMPSGALHGVEHFK